MERLNFFNFEMFSFFPFDCFFDANYFDNLLFATLGPICFSALLFAIERAQRLRAQRERRRSTRWVRASNMSEP